MPATTPPMETLGERLPSLNLPRPLARLVARGIAMDSRDVRPGDLFLACQGAQGHGIDHLPQARARGATAVLVEPPARVQEDFPSVMVPDLGARAARIAAEFFGRPATALQLFGITGTNGKTSVAYLLAQATTGAQIGTLGYGAPDELRPTRHTTPDPVRLQAVLAELRDQGLRQVAMEVSSHALEQGRVEGLRFDTAVFTNLSRDHLDYHGNMANYGASKAALFRSPGLRRAVVNVGDGFGATLLNEMPVGVTTLAFGEGARHAGASHWLEIVGLATGPEGLGIKLESDVGVIECRSRLIGRFNVENLLAVAGVLLLQDWTLRRIAEVVSELQPPPGRMQLAGGEHDPLIVVDYAHTPDALSKALAAMREHLSGRLHCVFGCGGDRDRGKRPLMGRVVEQGSDQAWVTDDNPRGEDGELIVADILAGMRSPEAARVDRNRRGAIRDAVAALGPEDGLLIAGKGHETLQLVGDLALPFSDIDEARAALAEVRS